MIYFFPIILAALGFEIAFHIHKKKKEPQPMVCPIGFDCHKVVHSDFGTFLKIPVEILGMLYYGLIVFSYLVFMIVPTLATPLSVSLILGLTTGALLFSLYLTIVQAFIIREWCSWCLGSAFICLLIFLTAMLSSGMSWGEIFSWF